jgi:hypothetical protein
VAAASCTLAHSTPETRSQLLARCTIIRPSQQVPVVKQAIVAEAAADCSSIGTQKAGRYADHPGFDMYLCQV